MKQTNLIASLCITFGASMIASAPASAEWQLGATSKVGFSFLQQGTKYNGRFDTFTVRGLPHAGSLPCLPHSIVSRSTSAWKAVPPFHRGFRRAD